VRDDEPKQIINALRNLQTIVDALQWIASRFDKAVDRIEAQQALDDVLRELSDYLTSNIDRIDRMLLLILEKLADPHSERVRRETGELRQETIDNRLRSLRAQLKQYQNNLNWLEEQAANYGTNVSLEIRNQITWTRQKINDIQNEISLLKGESELGNT
jgi:chromosome segregation ATPase